jgi:hypothetical protein
MKLKIKVIIKYRFFYLIDFPVMKFFVEDETEDEGFVRDFAQILGHVDSDHKVPETKNLKIKRLIVDSYYLIFKKSNSKFLKFCCISENLNHFIIVEILKKPVLKYPTLRYCITLSNQYYQWKFKHLNILVIG